MAAGRRRSRASSTCTTVPTSRWCSAARTNQLFLYRPSIDDVLAEQDGSTLHWLLGDNEQTVRDVVAANGTVLDHIRYGSFGNVTGQSGATAAPRFGFVGRELDNVSGMMDYRSRWYDPGLGRFLTVDSIGFAGGDTNLYRYVHNNPLGAIDPTGHMGAVARNLLLAGGGLAAAAVSVATVAALVFLGPALLVAGAVGLALYAGYSVGSDIEYAMSHGGWSALQAKKQQESLAREAQREAAAFNPCTDLLHDINSFNPEKWVSDWADNVGRLANSDNPWDVFKAGFERGEAVHRGRRGRRVTLPRPGRGSRGEGHRR